MELFSIIIIDSQSSLFYIAINYFISIAVKNNNFITTCPTIKKGRLECLLSLDKLCPLCFKFFLGVEDNIKPLRSKQKINRKINLNHKQQSIKKISFKMLHLFRANTLKNYQEKIFQNLPILNTNYMNINVKKIEELSHKFIVIRLDLK